VKTWESELNVRVRGLSIDYWYMLERQFIVSDYSIRIDTWWSCDYWN